MNFWRLTTKIFAIFSLIFFISNFVQAQSDSSIYELPAGTVIRVQMDNGINSKVSSVNDTFTTTIVDPVSVRGTVVVPIGAIIEGKVLKVKRAAIGNKNGSLIVSFETLRFADGEKRNIRGVLVEELEAETSQATTVLAIIGGTAVGGILGSVSNVNNGALIGAGIGAGAGSGIAFLRKGKNVEIDTNEKFEIKLTEKVILPVRDF
jgi:outer membrane lipoprotein SlyB